MSRFCTKCGKELKEGEPCSCKGNNLFQKVILLFRNKSNESTTDPIIMERDKKIVPDSIKADYGEIPIKQYKFAKLRSKLRGQHAEGRLQITNKRLIFRATGLSTLGKIITQEEFDVSKISGVAIKKSNRISFINIFLSFVVFGFITNKIQDVFVSFMIKTDVGATLTAWLLAIIGISFVVFLKKMFWAKLLVLTIGIGAMTSISQLPRSILDLLIDFDVFTVTNAVVFALYIFWIYSWLRVCLVPDLIFAVKSNSGNETFEIRRRIWGVFNKQPKEYSGFSEVTPWEDTDKVAEELGAIINDLQTTGDIAIEKWKED